MASIRTVLCALAVAVIPLLGGCGGPSEQRVEDVEPESVRNQRRQKHEKLMPKAPRPGDPAAAK